MMFDIPNRTEPWCCYLASAESTSCPNAPTWEIFFGPMFLATESTMCCDAHLAAMGGKDPANRAHEVKA